LNALYTLVDIVFSVAFWMILIWAVLGWLIAFNVINARNAFVMSVMRSLDALINPLLRPIRRILPTAGGIDFSPLVLLIALRVLHIFLLTDLFPWLFGHPTYVG